MEPTSSPVPTPVVPAPEPKEVLQKLLDGLGLQTTVEQHNLDGDLLLHISTAEPGRLIGKHGQTLSQLQFLVNRILQRAGPDAPRVTIDCEHYRERQRDDVLHIAIGAAEKVRRWGDPARIGPFNAFDRRVIHLHFQADPEIEAISEGEEDGGLKRMIVQLKTKPVAAPTPA